MSRPRTLIKDALEVIKDLTVDHHYESETEEKSHLLTIRCLQAYLATSEQGPVAWASESVIPLRGLKDNHPAILTPFRCEANTVALYAEPPDIAYLKEQVAKWKSLAEANANVAEIAQKRANCLTARDPLSDDEIQNIRTKNFHQFATNSFARAVIAAYEEKQKCK